MPAAHCARVFIFFLIFTFIYVCACVFCDFYAANSKLVYMPSSYLNKHLHINILQSQDIKFSISTKETFCCVVFQLKSQIVDRSFKVTAKVIRDCAKACDVR